MWLSHSVSSEPSPLVCSLKCIMELSQTEPSFDCTAKMEVLDAIPALLSVATRHGEAVRAASRDDGDEKAPQAVAGYREAVRVLARHALHVRDMLDRYERLALGGEAGDAEEYRALRLYAAETLHACSARGPGDVVRILRQIWQRHLA